jgi:hypothetical protein
LAIQRWDTSDAKGCGVKKLQTRKIIQGYSKRILIIGNSSESGCDTVNFPGNRLLMENGSLQQIESITGKTFDCILIYFDESNIRDIKDIGRCIDEFGQLLDINGNITITLNSGVLSEFTETEWENFLLQSEWILYHYGALNT